MKLQKISKRNFRKEYDTKGAIHLWLNRKLDINGDDIWSKGNYCFSSNKMFYNCKTIAYFSRKNHIVIKSFDRTRRYGYGNWHINNWIPPHITRDNVQNLPIRDTYHNTITKVSNLSAWAFEEDYYVLKYSILDRWAYYKEVVQNNRILALSTYEDSYISEVNDTFFKEYDSSVITKKERNKAFTKKKNF